MGTIDYIYMGIIGIFSLSCIIYGIRLAIKTKRSNIHQYDNYAVKTIIKSENHEQQNESMEVSNQIHKLLKITPIYDCALDHIILNSFLKKVLTLDLSSIEIDFLSKIMNLYYQDKLYANPSMSLAKLTKNILCAKDIKTSIIHDNIQSFYIKDLEKKFLNTYNNKYCIYPIITYNNALELINNSIRDKLFSLYNIQSYDSHIANISHTTNFKYSISRVMERIIKVCQEEGFPIPQIKYYDSQIYVILEFPAHRRRTIQAYIKDKIQIDPLNQERAIIERTIIELLKKNPYITEGEISVQLNINERSVKKCLKALRKKGLIKEIKEDKRKYWDLINVE